MGWHQGNSGETTHDVGEKQPNAWGLYDVHGNVWEWCDDWFEEYQPETLTDPQRPDSGVARVCRGGSYAEPAGYCRSAFRFRLDGEHTDSGIGLRLVITLGPAH